MLMRFVILAFRHVFVICGRSRDVCTHHQRYADRSATRAV